MSNGPFKTGKSPFPKGGYVVATQDGTQIICTMQPADYESDEQMLEVAQYIEWHVSGILNKQDIVDVPDDQPIDRLSTKIGRAGR